MLSRRQTSLQRTEGEAAINATGMGYPRFINGGCRTTSTACPLMGMTYESKLRKVKLNRRNKTQAQGG